MLDRNADRTIEDATTRVNSARSMPGSGKDFETESLPGALPQGQTNPQRQVKLDNTMAFMFEARVSRQLTAHAAALETFQDDHTRCGEGLERKFDGTWGPR